MINFRDPKDQTPSALAVLGMAFIGVAVIISLFFSPGVDANKYSSKARKDIAASQQKTTDAKEQLLAYKDSINKYQWTEKEDLVTPAALSIISRRTEESKLKLVSFRPLKSYESAALIQLPMQFTVDGSFANVAAMLESIEKSDSKLAIQQVQYASQEGGTDLVSANINLVAFLTKPVPTKKSTKSKTISVPKAPPTTGKTPAEVKTK